MTPATLLRQAGDVGVRVAVEQGRLVAYPAGTLPAALKTALLAQKHAVIEYLNDPRSPARAHHQAAVDEVAQLWDGLVARGVSSPELPPERQATLDDAIQSAFAAGDFARALETIDAWHGAWMEILAPLAEPPVDIPDCIAVASEVLGDEVVLFVRDQSTAVPPEHAGAVRYTHQELRHLLEDGGVDEPTLRAVHAAKKTLGRQVVAGPGSAARTAPTAPPALRPLQKGRDGVCSHSAHPRWRSSAGVVICGICHPPADPAVVAEWLSPACATGGGERRTPEAIR